jgi:hypothetical protein
MNECGWIPDENQQPHTDLHRHMVDGVHHHEITVTADDGTARVRLDITDPAGVIIGRISGEIPAGGLSAAGDLLGSVLSAAGLAHTALADPEPIRIDRRRLGFGAHWAPLDEEALLVGRDRAA